MNAPARHYNIAGCGRPEPRGQALRLLLSVALGIAGTAGNAIAAEHGSGEHGGSPLVGLVFTFINFAIFLWIMRRYAWPAIKRGLRARRERVIAALEAANQARAEAEAMKADFEAQMKTLAADSARARADVLAIAESEARQLIEAARLSAARIRADARLVAEQEIARAKRTIQEEMAERIAELAGRLIQANLTESDQARLRADFVSEVRSLSSPSATGPSRNGRAR